MQNYNRTLLKVWLANQLRSLCYEFDPEYTYEFDPEYTDADDTKYIGNYTDIADSILVDTTRRQVMETIFDDDVDRNERLRLTFDAVDMLHEASNEFSKNIRNQAPVLSLQRAFTFYRCYKKTLELSNGVVIQGNNPISFDFNEIYRNCAVCHRAEIEEMGDKDSEPLLRLLALSNSKADDSEVDDSEADDSEADDSEADDSEADDSEVDDGEADGSNVVSISGSVAGSGYTSSEGSVCSEADNGNVVSISGGSEAGNDDTSSNQSVDNEAAGISVGQCICYVLCCGWWQSGGDFKEPLINNHDDSVDSTDSFYSHQ